MVPLRILMVASEVEGFAKTGGLADVAASLPRALARRGHNVSVVMPLYQAVRRSEQPLEMTDHVIAVPIGSRTLACRVFRSLLPKSKVPIYFIEAPEYFGRDNPETGHGLYDQDMPGGYKANYLDNAERFIFFSRAALELLPALGMTPDIVHANDWQTGLIPAYLSESFRNLPGVDRIRSVFTIHNIGYQGLFGPDVMRLTGLPGWLFNPQQLEYYGQFNFLKSGIVFADAVNTVSPTYAREIQTNAYGCGLDGLLRHHADKLSGIVNGVDYDMWNPATDTHIADRYDTHTIFEAKRRNKVEMQKLFGIEVDPNRTVLGMVARLDSQKGIDLALSAVPGFLDLGCQMVFVGKGLGEYHDQLTSFQKQYPDKVGLFLGYNEQRAHLVEAGSDLFLMPSLYEPCGLNQMYSMKYGTPPVVRETGGLADTVVNATEENLHADIATGFSFRDPTAHALYDTVKWALHLLRNRPDDFRKVVFCAMRQDWSWTRSAADYESLYRRIMR